MGFSPPYFGQKKSLNLPDPHIPSNAASLDAIRALAIYVWTKANQVNSQCDTYHIGDTRFHGIFWRIPPQKGCLNLFCANFYVISTTFQFKMERILQIAQISVILLVRILPLEYVVPVLNTIVGAIPPTNNIFLLMGCVSGPK